MLSYHLVECSSGSVTVLSFKPMSPTHTGAREHNQQAAREVLLVRLMNMRTGCGDGEEQQPWLCTA